MLQNSLAKGWRDGIRWLTSEGGTALSEKVEGAGGWVEGTIMWLNITQRSYIFRKEKKRVEWRGVEVGRCGGWG